MKQKRKEKATEVHGKVRAQNEKAPRRVLVFLPWGLVVDVKTRAARDGTTMQKLLQDLIVKGMKE